MREKYESKKTAPTKIKVSQATIDKIKKMGMTKALAGSNSANPEMKEALKRMYGASRVSAAVGSSKAAKLKPVPERAAMKTPKAAIYKSADSARNSATKPPAKKTSNIQGKFGPTAQNMPKKTGTTDPFAKAVFGAGRAVGRVLSGKEATDRAKAAKAAAAAAAKKRAATK